MKKTHEYKIGDIVKFKFFDGQHYVGKIKELTYMGVITGTPNYQLPQYKIEVCEAKRTSYYTVSDMYFKEINGDLKIEHKPVTSIGKPVSIKTKPIPIFNELEDAIEKQKHFIRGTVTV